MTISDLKEQGLVIYEATVGSRLYGTATEESDEDVIGVYILPQEFILGGHGCSLYSEKNVQLDGNYIYRCIREQSNGKDCTYYELRHFLHLLANGSAQALETLFAGPMFGDTQYENIWNVIYGERKKFITNKLKLSFGYSSLQVLKPKEAVTVDLHDYLYRTSCVNGETLKLSLLTRNPQHVDAMDADYIQLSHRVGDLYDIWYNILEHNQRKHNMPKKSEFDGIVLEGGKLKSRELDMFAMHRMQTYKKGTLYFDRQAYEKALRNKPKTYSHKTKAHAYRLIKMVAGAAEHKEFHFPIKNMEAYHQIRKNGQVDKGLYELCERLLEDAFTRNTLPDYVDNEVLNKIETRMRSIFHLQHQKEHIS